jgi:putative peptidoglycan lipid II flippase
MKAAIVALIVNIIFSLILMFPLKHGGLALATSIASAVNVILLAVILTKKIGCFMDRDFYKAVFGIILASAVMWMAIILMEWFFPWQTEGSFQHRLSFLLAAMAVGGTTFFSVCAALKIPEMTAMISILKRKAGPS